MKFYAVDHFWNLPPSAKAPCFGYKWVDWDDYGFNTSFRFAYFSTDEDRRELGTVKILHVGHTKTELPKVFEELPPDQFSLGQSDEYYRIAKGLGPDIYIPYFRALNDVVFHSDLRPAALIDPGFSKSLLRFSEAEKAYNEAISLFVDASPLKVFQFRFKCHLLGLSNDHEIEFNFERKGHLPFRMMALVGKNGSGKTQCLFRLGQVLSGTRPDWGSVSPERPSFSKIHLLSYSAFDSFDIPEPDPGYSFMFSGIRRAPGEETYPNYTPAGTQHPAPDAHPLLTSEELIRRIQDRLGQVYKRDRTDDWIALARPQLVIHL
jgi:hypothetical protein